MCPQRNRCANGEELYRTQHCRSTHQIHCLNTNTLQRHGDCQCQSFEPKKHSGRLSQRKHITYFSFQPDSRRTSNIVLFSNHNSIKSNDSILSVISQRIGIFQPIKAAAKLTPISICLPLRHCLCRKRTELMRISRKIQEESRNPIQIFLYEGRNIPGA